VTPQTLRHPPLETTVRTASTRVEGVPRAATAAAPAVRGTRAPGTDGTADATAPPLAAKLLQELPECLLGGGLVALLRLVDRRPARPPVRPDRALHVTPHVVPALPPGEHWSGARGSCTAPGVGRPKKEKPPRGCHEDSALGASEIKPGGDLLSHAVSRGVPSALEGLTSVFGMGTGVTPPTLPPEKVSVHTKGSESSFSFALSVPGAH
jgi:hypothetical protein